MGQPPAACKETNVDSGQRKPRVAIVTNGRFHVLDLGRELEKASFGIDFYSMLPPWQLAARGLNPDAGRWLGWGVAPFFGLQRIAARLAQPDPRFDWLMTGALATTAALRLRRCDAFIGMAGMSLNAMRAASERHQAVTFIERSSQHIEDQLQILGIKRDRRLLERELAEYREADFITVPSRHVRKSFLDRGFETERLFLNTLGVDLDEFPWQPGPGPGTRLSVVYVGALSKRKGIDLLEAAADALPDVDFTLVGPTADYTPTARSNLSVRGPVPQRELTRFYGRADVMVLPSREDGFGMVMSQALVSGCHVVATDRTGGPDLVALTSTHTLSSPLDIVESGNVEALVSALVNLDVEMLRTRRNIPAPWRENLSWAAYAGRYGAMILKQLAHRHTDRSPR